MPRFSHDQGGGAAKPSTRLSDSASAGVDLGLCRYTKPAKLTKLMASWTGS